MKITVKRKESVEIPDAVVRKILGMYPEEELVERDVFKKGLEDGHLELNVLQEECEKISVPWQMFLLEEPVLDWELSHIEKQRHRVSAKMFSKRRGIGHTTSKRILDRLIRAQNYLTENTDVADNPFCGSLRGKTIQAAAESIAAFFSIDFGKLRRCSKEEALKYLIESFESKHINVCQGVLKNKILPELQNSREIYKNTSGFVIQDKKIPFVFIPSEINLDERDGRQIYTLVYLITLIGLDAYEYVIERDFKASLLGAKGLEQIAYAITSEFLLPEAITSEYSDVVITSKIRDALATRCKITSTAVIVILRKRGLIPNFDDYKALLPEKAPPVKSKGGKNQKIEKSVKKFNGKYVYEAVNKAIKSRKIYPVQAQYLLFGCVNKKNFKKYKENLSL